MGWYRDWSSLSRTKASELAEQWWASQPERLTWLAEELANAGIALSWDDDESVMLTWRWMTDWASDPPVLSSERPPVWYDEDQPGFEARFAAATAIAADALAHSLEAYVRSVHPELARGMGPRPHGKLTEHGWSGSWEGENEPVLILPADPTRFLVYIGCDEAKRLAGRAHVHIESPRSDLLIVRRNSALTRFETAAKFAEEGVRPIELEFDVEQSSDADYRWELWLDPLLAVDAEDKIPAFMRALGELPAVTGVYHQDREQLQVAGKITKKALLEFTRGWWATKARD